MDAYASLDADVVVHIEAMAEGYYKRLPRSLVSYLYEFFGMKADEMTADETKDDIASPYEEQDKDKPGPSRPREPKDAKTRPKSSHAQAPKPGTDKLPASSGSGTYAIRQPG